MLHKYMYYMEYQPESLTDCWIDLFGNSDEAPPFERFKSTENN